MGETSIEWTKGDDGSAGSVWNPVRGCSRVSPGCGGANHMGGCYAEKIAARFSGPGQPFEGFAVRTKHGGSWTGKMALVDDMLTVPLRWRKPRRIFVNSMSDLFHENLPDEAIDKVFAVMALANHHTFQLLTKRADRMRAYSNGSWRQRVRPWLDKLKPSTLWNGNIVQAWGHLNAGPLPNAWLGVSVEDQQRADERIPDLLATPAAIRFLSCEPLLGPLLMGGRNMVGDETYWNWLKGERGASVQHVAVQPERTAKLDWVITGGESGPNSRPAHPDWFRSIRDQCAAAGVPYFHKQNGAWAPGECADKAVTRTERVAKWDGERWDYYSLTPRVSEELHRDDEPDVYLLGKKAAGAKLDGVEHRDFPR